VCERASIESFAGESLRARVELRNAFELLARARQERTARALGLWILERVSSQAPVFELALRWCRSRVVRGEPRQHHGHELIVETPVAEAQQFDR
jgi:hypothetical protein